MIKVVLHMFLRDNLVEVFTHEVADQQAVDYLLQYTMRTIEQGEVLHSPDKRQMVNSKHVVTVRAIIS